MDHPKLNYQFQNKDGRDFKYSKIIAPGFLSRLPSQFSLQNKISIILNQANRQSYLGCTSTIVL